MNALIVLLICLLLLRVKCYYHSNNKRSHIILNVNSDAYNRIPLIKPEVLAPAGGWDQLRYDLVTYFISKQFHLLSLPT